MAFTADFFFKFIDLTFEFHMDNKLQNNKTIIHCDTYKMAYELLIQ